MFPPLLPRASVEAMALYSSAVRRGWKRPDLTGRAVRCEYQQALPRSVPTDWTSSVNGAEQQVGLRCWVHNSQHAALGVQENNDWEEVRHHCPWRLEMMLARILTQVVAT